MKKNLWLLGLLVFIFTSCDTPPGPVKDTWSDITSLDQVDGTWAVDTPNVSVPLIDIFEMLELSEIDGFDPVMIEAFIQDVNVVVAVKATITIDAGGQTMSGTAKPTVAFSGGSTPFLWALITNRYADMLPPGVIIDDETHSLTMESDVPSSPITAEDFADFQINQNGTKLKGAIDASELGGIGEWGSLIPSEVILEKQ